METDTQREELESFAKTRGCPIFGVADLEPLKVKYPTLLDRVPGDYPRAIVIGMRVHKMAVDDIVDEPTPLYYHHYRQLNFALDRIALEMANHIQDLGFSTLPIPASQPISKAPMYGHVSHRLLGLTAGIGHIGRSGLLIHPKYGAQARYVTILTDMPLITDKPYKGDCGDCHACIAPCPANAIGETIEDFDGQACGKQLNNFHNVSFVGMQICGVCIKHCPGTQR